MESSNGTMEPGRRDGTGREDEASDEKTSRRIEAGREGEGEHALNVSHPLPGQEIGAT